MKIQGSAQLIRPKYAVFILVGIGLVLCSRLLLPERSMGMVGWRAWLDASFSLALLGAVVLICTGMGRIALHKLLRAPFRVEEEYLFSMLIGLALFESIIFLFGLANLWIPWVLITTFGALAVLTWKEWNSSLIELLNALKGIWRAYRYAAPLEKVIFAVFGVITGLALLQALAPPWDYDGQMYHLLGPKLFLQAGGIRILPDLWQANGAILPDMLYLFGLAWGSETFARLTHLLYAILLGVAIYRFAYKYFGREVALFAVLLVMGIPMFPIWATWAYADMAWATAEFMTVWMLVEWWKTDRKEYLGLAGVWGGWALSSKYLAAGTLAIFGLWVLIHSFRYGVRKALTNGFLFGGLIGLVSGPWYLKNWILAGNPVYPFIWYGPGWDADRLNLLMAFLQGFGTGNHMSDYLLLPVHLFTHHFDFAGFMPQVEILNPLFVLVFLYPWVHRSRLLDYLAGYTGLRFGLWAVGSQQTRFLLPFLSIIAVLSAYVLVDLAKRISMPKVKLVARVLPVGLAGGMLAATLFYSIIHFWIIMPVPVILGGESKEAFLSRVIYSYPAWQYMQDHLSDDARVLLVGDGQGYYCGELCVPDPEQTRWAYFVGEEPKMAQLTLLLREKGITHLYLSRGDADFISRHDPTGRSRNAINYLINEYQPGCTRPVYEDRAGVLMEITCN